MSKRKGLLGHHGAYRRLKGKSYNTVKISNIKTELFTIRSDAIGNGSDLNAAIL